MSYFNIGYHVKLQSIYASAIISRLFTRHQLNKCRHFYHAILLHIKLLSFVTHKCRTLSDWTFLHERRSTHDLHTALLESAGHPCGERRSEASLPFLCTCTHLFTSCCCIIMQVEVAIICFGCIVMQVVEAIT